MEYKKPESLLDIHPLIAGEYFEQVCVVEAYENNELCSHYMKDSNPEMQAALPIRSIPFPKVVIKPQDDGSLSVEAICPVCRRKLERTAAAIKKRYEKMREEVNSIDD